jgi:hypothetical protein
MLCTVPSTGKVTEKPYSSLAFKILKSICRTENEVRNPDKKIEAEKTRLKMPFKNSISVKYFQCCQSTYFCSFGLFGVLGIAALVIPTNLTNTQSLKG